MTPAGFPHSDIDGSALASSSPSLFVGSYVLLRLPVPRHPPCALSSLTVAATESIRTLSAAVLGAHVLMYAPLRARSLRVGMAPVPAPKERVQDHPFGCLCRVLGPPYQSL